MALTAQSAYTTLLTDAPQAWLPVQDYFSLSLTIATQTIPNAALNCTTYLPQNLEVNINRMVERFTAYNIDTSTVADGLLDMIEDWDPYTLWLTQVSGGISPGDEFYYYCYNCTSFVQVNIN